MILINETPFTALLLDTILDEERMTASILMRVTYDLADGRLAIAAEQPWRPSREPWDSPQGQMEGDLPFMRGGVDLFLFGSACSPGASLVSQMEVSVEIGTFARRANVIGNRVWLRRDGKNLVPSVARPFAKMPLTLAHAFGGVVEWDGLAMPFAENPGGKGFCLEEPRAEGLALPNLEEPDSPTKAWNEFPAICAFGFCPMASAARFKNGFVLTPDFQLRDFRPELFNTAYPPMIAPEVKPGDAVRVTGVLHDGALDFVMPPPPAGVRLQFGTRLAERVPSIDQIGIEVEQRRVFVTYRFPFRYLLRPREFREATLTRGVTARKN